MISKERAAKQKAVGARPFNAEAELTDILKMTVSAESWDDTNGDGTLLFVSGCMLISQDYQTIQEIRLLVDGLTQELSAEK